MISLLLSLFKANDVRPGTDVATIRFRLAQDRLNSAQSKMNRSEIKAARKDLHSAWLNAAGL